MQNKKLTDDVIVMGYIEALRETNSLNEKKVIVKSLLENSLGRDVLFYTHSPTLTYGIDPKKVEIGAERKTRLLMNLRFPLVKGFLDDLASRKLSGNAAKTKVIEMLDAFTEEGRELLYGILKKDLRTGIGATLINEVEKGFIPQFKVMRAQPYEEKRITGKKAYAEWKLDGYRATFICVHGNGGFYSRSGKEYPSMQFSAAPLIKVMKAFLKVHPDFMPDYDGTNETLSFAIDAELMMGMFNETGAIRRKNEQAEKSEIHVFDLLTYKQFNGDAKSPEYKVRRGYVEAFVRLAWATLAENYPDMVQMPPVFEVRNHDHVMELFDKARSLTLAKYLARGDERKEAELLPKTLDEDGNPMVMEGLIVKIDGSTYVNKKSYDWLKVKAEETEDLVVIGAYPGEPETKYENCLGGIICDRKGVEVRVGGGFSDDQREKIWADYLADKKVMDERYLTIEEFTGGKLLKRMIEVEFHEVTPDGSLRHSRFNRFRDDKQDEPIDMAA